MTKTHFNLLLGGIKFHFGNIKSCNVTSLLGLKVSVDKNEALVAIFELHESPELQRGQLCRSLLLIYDIDLAKIRILTIKSAIRLRSDIF